MFKKGDLVEWSSQAGGFDLKKVGEIIVVVPPGIRPYKALENAGIDPVTDYTTNAIDPRTLSRKVESYIVKVGSSKLSSKARAKLYWPLVSKLRAWQS